jgi:hypothetical protein
MVASNLARVAAVSGISLIVLAGSPERLPADLIETDAYASIFGGTYNQYVFSELDGNPYHADLSKSIIDDHGSYAQASAESEFDHGVKLHALAVAFSAYDGDPLHASWSAGADAVASWYDGLNIVGAIDQDTLDQLPQTEITLHVFAHPSGNLTGEAEVMYNVSVDNVDYGYDQRQVPVDDYYHVSETGYNPLQSIWALTLYNSKRNPEDQRYSFSVPFSFSARLEAQANAHWWTTRSVVDYSHTLTFSPFLITDINGNYIPGSENWEIVGSSGLVYPSAVPVQSVPEPGSLTLIGLGAVGMACGAFRRRRSWQTA